MKQAYQESPLLTTESLAQLGAQRMLQAALEEEVESYLQRARYERKGVSQGYRSGYLPERSIILGSGAVPIKVPRVSDEPSGEKFQSRLVKPYQKRSQAVDALFPQLFIEGLATRDFEPALRALLGAEAALSPSTVSRLNQQFKEEYAIWQRRQLTETFVYVYVDGLYLAAGVGNEKASLLIVIGVDTSGRRHLLALQEGYRESKESWLGVLRDLQNAVCNRLRWPLATAHWAFGQRSAKSFRSPNNNFAGSIKCATGSTNCRRRNTARRYNVCVPSSVRLRAVPPKS